jgi:hypothetical protein
MPLVVVGATAPEVLEPALEAFEGAGFSRTSEISAGLRADGVHGLLGGGARTLVEADERGIRYVLVHVGPSDGEVGGTFERAHHRVDPSQVVELAGRLRTRERMLVRCLAFAYKNGVPEDAAWLVDVRFLANPYWVQELRSLDGRDAPVRDYVLGQPAAVELLDRLESILRWGLPLQRSRNEATVAFGCTGGRHRSVVLAREMARRLRDMDGADVVAEARDL